MTRAVFDDTTSFQGALIIFRQNLRSSTTKFFNFERSTNEEEEEKELKETSSGKAEYMSAASFKKEVLHFVPLNRGLTGSRVMCTFATATAAATAIATAVQAFHYRLQRHISCFLAAYTEYKRKRVETSQKAHTY